MIVFEPGQLINEMTGYYLSCCILIDRILKKINLLMEVRSSTEIR
jgi:hypothetical protein